MGSHRAHWEHLFRKLQQFNEERGHCKGSVESFSKEIQDHFRKELINKKTVNKLQVTEKGVYCFNYDQC
jgi:hypothetical protein